MTGSRCCPRAASWSSTTPRPPCSASRPRPFVREFVGADRGIRRLAVTPVIPATALRAPATVDGFDRAIDPPTIPATGTLRDALAVLLEGGTGWVAVRDGDEITGVLTPEDVYRAMHDSRPAEVG